MKGDVFVTPRTKPGRPIRLGVVVALAGTLLSLGACSSSRTTYANMPTGLAQDQYRRMIAAADEAEIAYRTPDRTKAIQRYTAAVDQYTEFPAAWNNLGVVLMESNRFAEALHAFATASQLSPSDPRPLYNLGLLWDRRGWMKEAASYYRQALERDPNNLDALRGAIRAGSLLNEANATSLENIRRALFLEQDERWIKWVRMEQVRVQSALAAQTGAVP